MILNRLRKSYYTYVAVCMYFDKHIAMIYLGHAQSRDVTSRYICSDEQTTLKISNTLCSLVPELAEFTMSPEEITQNDVSNSQLSEKTQER